MRYKADIATMASPPRRIALMAKLSGGWSGASDASATD
jgi:hypothetical protein